MTVHQAIDAGFRYNPSGKPEDHPKVGMTLRLRHAQDLKKHTLVKILNMEELAAVLNRTYVAPPVEPLSDPQLAEIRRTAAERQA